MVFILTSIAWIILVGLLFSSFFKKMKLPGLVGFILAGILLGPNVLNVMDDNLLLISEDLRQMALIVILFRAGLTLDIHDLKKNGRPAFFLAFLPATFEMLTVTMIAPIIFGINLLEAAILGAVLGAVSPAVVVPRMIYLIEEGYGKEKGIPQMILAGASVDDIYVIVLFTSLVGMFQGNGFDFIGLILIPISILMGILIGYGVGYLLTLFFKKFHLRDTIKVFILFSVCFLLISVENSLKGILPFSGLIAVMAVGLSHRKYANDLANRLNEKFTKIWLVAEIFLFVLVGSEINISVLKDTGLWGVLIIVTALVFRLMGVIVSLLGTNLNNKERLFTAGAYTPKATVQAAIGSIPLALGIPSGDLILTIAVLSILITAPLGALFIDRFYPKFLEAK